MKKEMSELKKRALLAKQRLKMGYWQKMEKERNELSERFGGNIERVQRLQRASIARDVMQIFDSNRAKEEEEIVKKILEEEMKGAASLAVTLEVDVHSGQDWYDAK